MAVKLISPEIPHKTEARIIQPNVDHETAIRHAYRNAELRFVSWLLL